MGDGERRDDVDLYVCVCVCSMTVCTSYQPPMKRAHKKHLLLALEAMKGQSSGSAAAASS